MFASVTVRPAEPEDRSHLRQAIIELQDYERALHATRLPGDLVADAYLDWLRRRADAEGGAMLVAEREGVFAGFVVGWIEVSEVITETRDSNRFGYVSDICVVSAFRGQRIAAQLLRAIELHLRRAGVVRLRINALAANASARVCYERAGYAPYEVHLEKFAEAETGPL